MNRWFIVLSVIALLLVATGCDNGGSTLIMDMQLEELEQEIKAIIEPPIATHLAQCRTIAFGAKGCGGPKTYLIYSTARTDTNRLRQLVNEYNRLDTERNERLGTISDCLYVHPPQVILAGGQCHLRWPHPVNAKARRPIGTPRFSERLFPQRYFFAAFFVGGALTVPTAEPSPPDGSPISTSVSPGNCLMCSITTFLPSPSATGDASWM